MESEPSISTNESWGDTRGHPPRLGEIGELSESPRLWASTRFIVAHPLVVMVLAFVISLTCAVKGLRASGDASLSFTDLQDPRVRMMYGITAGMKASAPGKGLVQDPQSQRSSASIQIMVKSWSWNAFGEHAIDALAAVQEKVPLTHTHIHALTHPPSSQ